MKDFEIWQRVSVLNQVPSPVPTTRQLYVPAVEPVGNLPYELAGLLPNREHSRDLMALIEALPENRCGHRSVVGVFAADPFLNCKLIADRLIAKGYDQVTNIPPVAGYGTEFLSTLDKVASGQAQEQRNLSQLMDRNLSVLPAVASIDCLPASMEGSPRRLWIAPSFDMYVEEAIRADLLLGLCRDVTRRTDVPVLLVAGHTGITAAQAAQAGARGILLDVG